MLYCTEMLRDCFLFMEMDLQNLSNVDYNSVKREIFLVSRLHEFESEGSGRAAFSFEKVEWR